MNTYRTLGRAALILSIVACARSEPKAIDTTVGAAPPPRPGSAAVAVPSDANSPWHVSVGAVGPLRIGMTLAEAASALKVSVPDTAKLDRACAYVRLDSVPTSVKLMWVEGHLARVDVDSASIPTEAGARVGDSESNVRKLYDGRFTESPHKYVQGGKYIVVSAPMAGDGTLRLVFETDGSKVTRYRAGREPEVEMVEGCS
ncbi:MAG: hypothetical protein ABIT38_16000 [Gemmatimonadaceae bacterium]